MGLHDPINVELRVEHLWEVEAFPYLKKRGSEEEYQAQNGY